MYHFIAPRDRLRKQVEPSKLTPFWDLMRIMALTTVVYCAMLGGFVELCSVTGAFDVQPDAPVVSVKTTETIEMPDRLTLSEGEFYIGYWGYATSVTNYGIYASASGGGENYAVFGDGNAAFTGNVTMGDTCSDVHTINGTLLLNKMDVEAEINALKAKYARNEAIQGW